MGLAGLKLGWAWLGWAGLDWARSRQGWAGLGLARPCAGLAKAGLGVAGLGWDGLSSVPRLPSPAYHLTAFRPCLPSHLPVPPFRMSQTPVCPLRSLLLPVAPYFITFQRNPPRSRLGWAGLGLVGLGWAKAGLGVAGLGWARLGRPGLSSVPAFRPVLCLPSDCLLSTPRIPASGPIFLPAPTFWSSFLSHHLPSHSQPIHFCHCLFHLRFLSLPSVPVLAIPVYPCIPFCPHIQSPIFPVWPHPLHVCSRSRLFVAPCHHACGCSLS